MGKYKFGKMNAVLLDFDGTLVDLKTDWVGLKNNLSKLSAELGYDSIFTPLYPEINKLLLFMGKKLGIDAENQLRNNIFDIIKAAEITGLKTGSKIEYSDELLFYFQKNNIPIIIASQNSRDVVNMAIEIYDWPNVKIIGREDTTKPKPDAETISKYLMENNIKSGDVWGVGNSKVDYVMFTSAKLEKILIISKKNLEGVALNRYLRFNNLKILYKWIKEN